MVSVEEYLRTSYRPDCDYVDGEVQERNLGEFDHSVTQTEALVYLRSRYPQVRGRLLLAQRIQVKPTRFRVPDLCVLADDAPHEQVLTYPPMLCIEILSPEDRWSPFFDRLRDYAQMGVPICWVIDPAARRASVATAGRLTNVTDGILRCGDLEMPLAAILE